MKLLMPSIASSLARISGKSHTDSVQSTCHSSGCQTFLKQSIVFGKDQTFRKAGTALLVVKAAALRDQP